MSDPNGKPILLSGIQPTGELTIGNYLGAIRSWVALQEQYDCLFVLVDLHAITVRQDPTELLRRSYEFLTLYLACGIDPDRSTVFVQSHVPAHAELAWILNCFTSMGEASRMTQFKEKAERFRENVNVGLFAYPVLMAADILLHEAALVPVGDDQKQHLELTRTLARRFNSRYGEVFVVPEPFIPDIGARIMSLKDPTRKMSKTDEDADTYVALLDDADTVRRKIARAVTDSGRDVRYANDKPAISNLLAVYAAFAGEPVAAVEARYAGAGYARFKTDLAERIVESLRPIQERYRSIREDDARLTAIIRTGAAKAREHSQHVIHRVHRALGFIPG